MSDEARAGEAAEPATPAAVEGGRAGDGSAGEARGAEPVEPGSEPAAERVRAEAPFAGLAGAESATSIEDAPPEGSSSTSPGELDVPDGYAVLEGDADRAPPLGRRRRLALQRRDREPAARVGARRARRGRRRQDAITVMPVPGAFELPLAAMALAKTRRYACIVALGCVIRGETPHFDYVAGEAASGLQLAGDRDRRAGRVRRAHRRHASSRPRRGSTRAPRPCGRRSRWPTCSRSCARSAAAPG